MNSSQQLIEITGLLCNIDRDGLKGIAKVLGLFYQEKKLFRKLSPEAKMIADKIIEAGNNAYAECEKAFAQTDLAGFWKGIAIGSSCTTALAEISIMIVEGTITMDKLKILLKDLERFKDQFK